MIRMMGGCLVLLLAASGCGQPQLANAEEEDYRLVMQLNAALASQRADLLETTAERLESRRQQGKIPSGAVEAMQAMIQLAQQGDWKQAHQDCLRFMKGQKGNPQFAR